MITPARCCILSLQTPFRVEIKQRSPQAMDAKFCLDEFQKRMRLMCFNRFEYDMTIVYTYIYIHYIYIIYTYTQYDYYRSQMKLKHEAHRGDVDSQWAISAVESQRHPPTPRQKFPSLSEQSRRAGKPKPTISPSLKLGRYEKTLQKQCKTCSCRGHVVVVVDRRTSKNDEPTRISASCSVSSRPSCK